MTGSSHVYTAQSCVGLPGAPHVPHIADSVFVGALAPLLSAAAEFHPGT